jgi:hypothetical protein
MRPTFRTPEDFRVVIVKPVLRGTAMSLALRMPEN